MARFNTTLLALIHVVVIVVRDDDSGLHVVVIDSQVELDDVLHRGSGTGRAEHLTRRQGWLLRRWHCVGEAGWLWIKNLVRRVRLLSHHQ